jgi:hypothetical protein
MFSPLKGPLPAILGGNSPLRLWDDIMISFRIASILVWYKQTSLRTSLRLFVAFLIYWFRPLDRSLWCKSGSVSLRDVMLFSVRLSEKRRVTSCHASKGGTIEPPLELWRVLIEFDAQKWKLLPLQSLGYTGQSVEPSGTQRKIQIAQWSLRGSLDTAMRRTSLLLALHFSVVI